MSRSRRYQLLPISNARIALQQSLNKGLEAEAAGDWTKAEARFRDLVVQFYSQKVNPAPCYFLLGRAQYHLGKLGESIESLKRSVQFDPNAVDTHILLAMAYRRVQDTPAAEKHALAAVRLAPDSLQAHLQAGLIYAGAERLSSAAEHLEFVIERAPGSYDALQALGIIHSLVGDVERAVSFFEAARQVNPNTADLSSYLMTLLYDDRTTPEKLLDEHRKWGKLVEANTPKSPAEFSTEQGSRLRIGYVSSDFRVHSMLYFLQALALYHDRSRFEVICFHNNVKTDSMTQIFKKRADQWFEIVSLSDDQVSDLIRDAKIDILVDLNGHTAGNRLPLFARRLAPVQMTWMGYSSTTGLSAIDHIIVDQIVAPENGPVAFTEKPIRMPNCYMAYTPGPAPGVQAPPHLENGFTTFGCFNNPAKITPRMIRLWAQILHQCPRSVLVLAYGSRNDSRVTDRFKEQFAMHGIGSDRFHFTSFKNTWETFWAYQAVDVALDPTPYNGTTTTCEALWMGVPVVTILGDMFVSRVSASILVYTGMEGLICESDEEYVAKAVELANDSETLVRLRSSMRDHLRQTPVFQGERFVKDLEAVYERVFAEWRSRADVRATELLVG